MMAMTEAVALKADQPPEVVSVPEAARRLGVSRMTAFRWVRDGQLPAVRLRVGSRIINRVAAADIDRILAESRAISTLSPDTAALLEWMVDRDRDRSSVCPSCGSKAKDAASPYGWCVGCTTERRISEDEAKDRERARQRRWWNENGPAWRQDRKAKEKAKRAATAETETSDA